MRVSDLLWHLEVPFWSSRQGEGMLFDLGYADDITPVLAVPERTVPDGVRAG